MIESIQQMLKRIYSNNTKLELLHSKENFIKQLRSLILLAINALAITILIKLF